MRTQQALAHTADGYLISFDCPLRKGRYGRVEALQSGGSGGLKSAPGAANGILYLGNLLMTSSQEPVCALQRVMLRTAPCESGSQGDNSARHAHSSQGNQ